VCGITGLASIPKCSIDFVSVIISMSRSLCHRDLDNKWEWVWHSVWT